VVEDKARTTTTPPRLPPVRVTRDGDGLLINVSGRVLWVSYAEAEEVAAALARLIE
jgi:hypothetical protein